MRLVVLLKGVNVGGHRTIRPTELTKRLRRFDVVSIGAAGTFIIRARATRTEVLSALTRHLPFSAQVMICSRQEILRLASEDPYSGEPGGPAWVQFVSVLARRPRVSIELTMLVPDGVDWGVKVIAVRDRFVIGVHRRQMKTIGQLAQVERHLGSPMTTRSWSTMQRVARLLEA